MKVILTVEVELDRTQGKFASKDDIAEVISDWLENANEGAVSGVGSDGDSEYDVTDWTVTSS